MVSLTLKNIHKSFGQTTVLKDVSLSIKQGELVSILGESGSGKSTLLRVISGLEQADEGQVFKDSLDLTHVAPNLRRIGMVFQESVLFPHLNVLENVAFGLRMRSVKREQRLEVAKRCLSQVKILDYAHRRPDQLSGGQAQRVAIARTLATSPDILLLDEPFSSLDQNLRQDMCELLLSIKNDLKQTIVLVTHDVDEALAISDRVAILAEHKIIACDTPRNLYESPRSLYQAKFLGDINVLGTSSKGVVSLIRPESITVETCFPDTPLPGGHVELKGVIETSLFSGSLNVYKIRVVDQVFTVKTLNKTPFKVEDSVLIRYATSRVMEVQDSL